jgi:hypothetical protein
MSKNVDLGEGGTDDEEGEASGEEITSTPKSNKKKKGEKTATPKVEVKKGENKNLDEKEGGEEVDAHADKNDPDADEEADDA